MIIIGSGKDGLPVILDAAGSQMRQVVVSQEGVDRMSEVQRDESFGVLEREWRRAVVEVERARQKYLRCLEATDAGESRFRQAWLHLYRAERRRDELLISFE
jgi:hypothetical protein